MWTSGTTLREIVIAWGWQIILTGGMCGGRRVWHVVSVLRFHVECVCVCVCVVCFYDTRVCAYLCILMYVCVIYMFVCACAHVSMCVYMCVLCV